MSNATPVTEPGMFALVLHSHLPWLANHGRWPVGEERIYQSSGWRRTFRSPPRYVAWPTRADRTC